MNNLPNELLPNIMEQIDRNDLWACSLVNRSFYIATLPYLWRRYNDDHESPQPLLDLLGQTHHPMTIYLRHLELDEKWNDKDFLLLLPHLNLLEELMIRLGQSLSSTVIQQLAQHCPHLKILRLWFTKLSQQTMDAIAQHCYQLEQLDLRLCTLLTTDLFNPLVQHGTPLKKLWLFNNLHQRYWNQDTLIEMAGLTKLTQLTHLDFSTGWVDLVRYLLLSASASSDVWPKLTHLHFHAMGGDIDVHLLLPFIQSRPLLESLALSGYPPLNDTVLDAIATFLPVLEYLNVNGANNITACGIRHMVQHCPRLNCIDISGCYISVVDFPEAGLSCHGYTKDHDGHTLLHKLDQDALNNIRLGHDHGNST